MPGVRQQENRSQAVKCKDNKPHHQKKVGVDCYEIQDPSKEAYRRNSILYD
jgi:hypothetical protein